MPLMKFERSRAAGPACRMDRTLPASSCSTTRSSRRASHIPRQACGPPRPKAMWAVRARRLALRLDALRKELAMTPAARARAPTPGRPPMKGEERLFDD